MRKPQARKAAPTRATREQAVGNQTTHALMPGHGYIQMGSPGPMGPLGNSEATCLPSSVAANGSQHWLQPPLGHPRRVATWLMAQKAWAMPGGKRMAFEADYLASHGWTYIGPADGLN